MIPIQTYVILIAFIFGCILFKSLMFNEIIVIFILGLNVLTDLYCIFFLKNNQNNHGYYSILTLTEGTITLLVFRNLYKTKLLRFGLSIAIPVLVIWGIFNVMFVQGFNHFNTYTFSPLGIVVMLSSYLYIRESIGTEVFSKNNLILWFSLASFVYFGLSALNMSITLWEQMHDIKTSKILLEINKYLYIVFSVLVLIGLVFKFKTRRV